MANTLTVTVKQKTVDGTTTYEGSYQLPSSTTAKLARKDGTTKYPNRGALTQAGRKLATLVGMDVEFVEVAKKAAKKSTTPKKTVSSS